MVDKIDVDRLVWREIIASEHGPEKSATRLVLLVISLHMKRGTNRAFPGQTRIAQRCALSERKRRDSKQGQFSSTSVGISVIPRSQPERRA